MTEIAMSELIGGTVTDACRDSLTVTFPDGSTATVYPEGGGEGYEEVDCWLEAYDNE